MDGSGPDRYTFAEHYEYFIAALDALEVKDNVTLVIHDWGSALGLHWANQNLQAVEGIFYMEAIVAPFPSWDHFPNDAAPFFKVLDHPRARRWCLTRTCLLNVYCSVLFCAT